MEWCYNDDYIMHFGINGMKWGVRRFQYKDGTLTPEGRIRYNVGPSGELIAKSRKEVRAGRKAYKTEQAEIKRQKRLEAEEETLRKKKARILKSKDAKAVFDNIDLFTNNELQEFINRMNLEKSVNGLVPKEKRIGYSEAVDAIAKGVGSTANLIKKGSEFYNNVAEITNAAGGDLPLIGKERKPKETEAQKELKRLKEENELMSARKKHNELTTPETEEARELRQLRTVNDLLAARERNRNLNSNDQDTRQRASQENAQNSELDEILRTLTRE